MPKPIEEAIAASVTELVPNETVYFSDGETFLTVKELKAILNAIPDEDMAIQLVVEGDFAIEGGLCEATLVPSHGCLYLYAQEDEDLDDESPGEDDEDEADESCVIEGTCSVVEVSPLEGADPIGGPYVEEA